MNKADGQKIAIKFTQALEGDVSGLIPAPLVYDDITAAVISYAVSSYYNSTYSAAKAFDGSVSTYWRASSVVSQWIRAGLDSSRAITKLRMYVNNYKPKDFTLSGSEDNISYTVVYTGVCDNDTSGWKEFVFENPTACRYYRIDILSTWFATSLYIYEIELHYFLPVGNERAFSVTGQEYNYTPGGIPVDGDYRVASVEAHPVEPNAVLLLMQPLKRFHNCIGALTVAYDKALGNLRGAGGAVESFTRPFMPAGLTAKPNPHDPENIGITAVSPTGSYIRVYYVAGYSDDHVEISVQATGALIDIDDI